MTLMMSRQRGALGGELKFEAIAEGDAYIEKHVPRSAIPFLVVQGMMPRRGHQLPNIRDGYCCISDSKQLEPYVVVLLNPGASVDMILT